jgi:cyclophilin family peptidyl-prolyl cis-trans isomerase
MISLSVRLADPIGSAPVEKRDNRLIVLGVLALLAAGVVAAILIGRGGDDDSAGTTAEGCRQVEEPAPKQLSFDAPGQVLKRGEPASAVVETSCGSFTIELDTERAPKTANSFAFLAEEGFYDGLGFHRVVPEFVIQGGDPKGDGTGGPGYSVDEKPPANLAYTKGVVAMAKSSAEPPGRSGSQFYVVTGADAGLPPEYALVGEVSEGIEVVERIGALGTSAEKPKQPIVIDSVTIEDG